MIRVEEVHFMVEKAAGTFSRPGIAGGHAPGNTSCRRPVAAAACVAWVAAALAADALRAGVFRGSSQSAGTCTATKSQGMALGEAIGIEAAPGLPRRLVADAIALWSACANYGAGFPRLVAGSHGSRVIRVEQVRGVEGRRCGSFTANTIRVHAFARDGDRLVPCQSAERILAHEIGHALGLADAPDLPGCRGYIMAGAFDPRGGGRRVHPSECQVVGQRWLTPEEHQVQELLVREWGGDVAPEEVP